VADFDQPKSTEFAGHRISQACRRSIRIFIRLAAENRPGFVDNFWGRLRANGYQSIFK
jgi:hypothetical protein